MLIINQLMINEDTTNDIKISNAFSGIILLMIIHTATNKLDTRIAFIGAEFLFSFDKKEGAFPCSAKPNNILLLL